MHHRYRQFTLIELLVVIAIISILASMLLPALNRAKDSAKTVLCISNLKQYSLSIQTYTEDFNNAFPFSYFVANSHSDNIYWMDSVTSEGYASISLYYDYDGAGPNGRSYYYRNPPQEALMCPIGGQIVDTSNYHRMHYNMNEHLVSSDIDSANGVAVKMTSVKQTSKTPLLNEGADYWQKTTSPYGVWNNRFYPEDSVTRRISFQHSLATKLSMSFVDGHAELIEDYGSKDAYKPENGADLIWQP